MFTLDQIASALGRPVHGDGSLSLRRAAEPDVAGPEDLALAMAPRYEAALKAGRARAAILWDGADWQALGLEAAILVPRARLALAEITAALDPGPNLRSEIHPTALVDPTAQICAGAAIGAYAVIGAGAQIGPGARVAAHVCIGDHAVIGPDALIHPRVVIGARVQIGARFTCQPGAVIGGDGFSFVTAEESGVERARRSLGDRGPVGDQRWTRIHSLGSVVIGDDVEVGANATIDRGTISDTVIGRGTKIDNLVMVGHNNRIGEDCLLCGMVGLAGGSRIGDRVVLAGQVGVTDNTEVGDDVVAGGGSIILSKVPKGEVVLGYPAVKMDTNMGMYRALRRLPRLAKQVAEMRRAMGQGKRDDG